MSNQHVPDIGCRALLDMLAGVFGSDLLVHLFRVDRSPEAGDVVASFTEADYEGYSPLAAVDWSEAQTLGGISFVEAAELTFVKGVGGVGNDVYGYFVTDPTGLVLLWAERDPSAPIDLSADGSIYFLTPRLRLGSQPG